ncbi:D-alanine--D-alanine ligase [Allofustis seminis]|uniref:D-alanine--D-alanine ligase n=1 Tax=Allofustis seminis TaxID=166939 RepID=UPI00047626BD|nr:D-alanine--D-alanine ligase [Allofustis seminis]
MHIYLLYGGKSAEHDVSIISAYHILQEIYYNYYEVTPVYITMAGQWFQGSAIHEKEQVPSIGELRKVAETGTPFDLNSLHEEECVVFPVLHGPNGEDGTIQGLLEMLAVPYVGAGVLPSAAGMDKIMSKILFKEAGIPILPFVAIHPAYWETSPQDVMDKVEKELAYPYYVKPANLGSSVGISEVHSREELEEAIELAFEYDHRVLVEQGIYAREVEVAVLGNEDVNTSVVGELVKETQFYDYESKYVNNEVTLQIPADLSAQASTKIREYAAKAFMAIDGNGLSRADFFVTNEEEIFINELNTFPGFTPISMYPKLWEATGLAYGDLIEELIQLALKRFKMRQARYGKARN